MSSEISFSIITVTYNAKDDLLKTIDSIQNQDYKFFSHLIKDGLSNDNTNKIDFSKYRNTEFHQSKDKGVYDAMNQAFKLSINEYIIYLNAGDIFFSKNTLRDLSRNILKNPKYNSYSGITLQISKRRLIRAIGGVNLYKYLPLAQLPHPSFVIKKSILSDLKEPFDSKLKISADYKQQFILRKNNLWKNYNLNQIISIMPIGGISTSNKRSILDGYIETIIFSIDMYKFFSIYILFIKIFFNFYSRFRLFHLKNLNNYY